MRRTALWLVALALGSLAGRGIDGNLAGVRGRPAFVLMLAVTLVTAFTAVCIVTAMESLFPSFRHQSRRTRQP